MKIQEALESYNVYKARISMVEAEIKELEDEIVEVKSANLDGMPKAKGFVESSLENQVVEKEEKIEKKKKYKEKLEQIIKITEDLVKTLKKYNQDIIEMRFYAMMSIEEIAVKKDKTYGAVKKAIDRSIRILQREYDRNKKLSWFCT